MKDITRIELFLWFLIALLFIVIIATPPISFGYKNYLLKDGEWRCIEKENITISNNYIKEGSKELELSFDEYIQLDIEEWYENKTIRNILFSNGNYKDFFIQSDGYVKVIEYKPICLQEAWVKK